MARLWLAVLVLVSTTTSAAREDLRRFESVEPHMGTLVKITLYAPGEQAARDAFRAAFDRIQDLDVILSDYRTDSELNQITTAAVGRPVAVSRDLFIVLAASQHLAELTGGAFDITQGPVIRLWREARKTTRLPDQEALRQAASRSGFRRLHLDSRQQTVQVDIPGMALDVGAVGKGYAASEAIKVLDRLGIGSALVAVSGDLAFSAAPPGERGWRIAVHSENPTITSVPAVLELAHGAVSTSGSSEQHLDVNGTRYSHVIDPFSGMGLVHDITVTVIARDGLQADSLDTALDVLGRDKGLALIESIPDAAALVIERTSAGTTVVPSSRFPRLPAGTTAGGAGRRN